MNIAITGATSLIGQAIIQAAEKRNDKIFAFVRPNSGKLKRIIKTPNITIIPTSLKNLLLSDYNIGECDVFFHIGWDNGSAFKPLRDDFFLQEANISYTMNAIELAHSLKCKVFVGAGSQAEYGFCDDVISADTLTNPESAYGISKYSSYIFTSRLCEKYGMKYIWARIFSVYGPYDHDYSLISYSVDCFLKHETAHFSAATNMWNYLYSSDAGEMIYRLGTRDVSSGIYCIANSNSNILKYYILDIADCFTNAKYTFSKDINKPSLNLNVDISKTIEATDYCPRVSFKEGILNVIQERAKAPKTREIKTNDANK